MTSPFRSAVLFDIPNVPFGGYEDSGVDRLNGIERFDHYLETKSLTWPAGWKFGAERHVGGAGPL